MRTVPALRTITLTEVEADVIYEILVAAVETHHHAMTDDELVRAIELRDRFRPEEDQ